MRIYLVTALLSLTLLCQVWGVPKTILVETKDDHENDYAAKDEFGVRDLKKFDPFGASVAMPYEELEKSCNNKGHNCSCEAPLYCDPKDCTCRVLTLEICPPRNNGDICEKPGICTVFANGTEVGRCNCRCGLCKDVTEEGEESVWQMCQTKEADTEKVASMQALLADIFAEIVDIFV